MQLTPNQRVCVNVSLCVCVPLCVTLGVVCLSMTSLELFSRRSQLGAGKKLWHTGEAKADNKFH